MDQRILLARLARQRFVRLNPILTIISTGSRKLMSYRIEVTTAEGADSHEQEPHRKGELGDDLVEARRG